MFKYTSSERTINADIKMLNEENDLLLKKIKQLQEEIINLQKHIELKDEHITEMRFKINAYETLIENWEKYNG